MGSRPKVAVARGHEGHHVVWLGLSGETDWGLMPRIIEGNFTFVTNNAADFRKLFAREELHAGLVIIVPQVRPALQKELFGAVPISRVPQGHKRLPVRLGCPDPCRISFRHRHRASLRTIRPQRYRRPRRRKLRCRLIMPRQANPVSNHPDAGFEFARRRQG